MKKNVSHIEGFLYFLRIVKRQCISFVISFFELFWKIYYRKPIILFESVPDFADNTRYVFDEMVRRELYKKYTFVWLAYKKDLKRSLPHSELAFDDSADLIRKAQINIVRDKALALIFCSRRNAPRGNRQIVFYLSHGTPIKDVSTYYYLPREVDFCLCTSPNTIDLTERSFLIDKIKIVPLGFPRNDSFFKSEINIHKLLDCHSEKVIVWYPTFRKERGMLPLIHNAIQLNELNDFCKSINIMVVIKFHFHDGIENSEHQLSNIRFIDNDFYTKNDILSYDFLNSTDALITDYSSVYFDYLLCNKPIGVIWEDIEEYQNSPGFAVDLDTYLAGAVKIYTIKELMDFLFDVKIGNDKLSTQRKHISGIVNSECHENTSSKVVDFILEKLKTKI